MKKILPTLALLLFLTACTDKWTVEHPDMPENLRTQLEQNITVSEATLATDPSNVKALFSIGFAYDQLGDYRKAIEYYEKVLEQSENDNVTLNNLASVYESVGEYDQAAEYIKKLYVLDPTSPEVIKDTVRILLEAGDPTHATEAVTNFVNKNKESGTTDAATAQMISDLFVEIDKYKTAHPEQQ